MPELRLSRRTRLEIAALPPAIGAAVLSTLTALAANPWEIGKPLEGRYLGMWVLRVGNYRVLYTIEGPEARATVVVRGVTHRALVYRRRRQK